MTVAIEIKNLFVERSGKPILKDLTFEVKTGLIYGLFGPSGSGKTTLMRSIVGLQKITSGEIKVLGQPAGSKELRSEIGYSTQIASIYQDLTCLENNSFFQSLYPKTSLSTLDRLEQVRLTSNKNQIAATLSGGERTRLALATSLMSNPRLLILDEPTIGLDPLLRRDLWALFKTQAHNGVTIIISSHAMDEADNCDELIFLRNGEVLAAGSPSDLKEKAGETLIEKVFIFLSVQGNLAIAQAVHPSTGTIIAKMSVPKITACPKPFNILK